MKIAVLNSPARVVRLTAEVGLFAGRLCLAGFFLAAALHKAIAPEFAEQMLAAHGFSPVLIWPALVLNAFGAACLIMGLWLGPMAFLLALYCMATSVFHYIPDDPVQMSILLKNWAIAGGLLVLTAHEALHPRS